MFPLLNKIRESDKIRKTCIGDKVQIKRWKLREYDQKQAQEIASQLQIPLSVANLLAARGYTKEQVAEQFLQTDVQFSDPFLFKDMEKAVRRIWQAVKEQEPILIYGDYDCDGITSTAVLLDYLESIGADVSYYIPNRHEEGYGLNVTAINFAKDNHISLIITVDNGVNAVEEVTYAKQIGIDVVVTDHHKPTTVATDAVAVVDAHQMDCNSAFKYFSGVGVVFKLLCAMEQDDGYQILDRYGDLITVGTIADVVSLTGENRQIVKIGLQHLAQTENIGLQKIIELAGLNIEHLTAESVAFGIVPRINVAGRLADASDVVDMLVSQEEDDAEQIAQSLNQYNSKRRLLEAQIQKEIAKQIEQNPAVLQQKVLILSGQGWHQGVIGIVAAKVCERYEKPCVVLSINEDGLATGSARSIEGFSIIDAITDCAECLERYGGHELAAGMTLTAEKIPAFQQKMIEYCQKIEEMPVRVIQIDGQLGTKDIAIETIRKFDLLSPFGQENEVPLFMIHGAVINAVYPTADNKHIRIRFMYGGTYHYALLFFTSKEQFPFLPGEIVDLVVTASVDVYNGIERVSLKIKDIRAVSFQETGYFVGKKDYQSFLATNKKAVGQDNLPSRSTIAIIYKFLRSQGQYSFGYDMLYMKLSPQIPNYCKFKIGLDVLEELGLILIEQKEGDPMICVTKNPQKQDINCSTILQKARRWCEKND